MVGLDGTRGAIDAAVPQHVELRLRQGQRRVDRAKRQEVETVAYLRHVLGSRNGQRRGGGSVRIRNLGNVGLEAEAATQTPTEDE